MIDTYGNLDFDRYTVRPTPRGWVTACHTCHEGVRSRDVRKVIAWQSRHDCVAVAAEAARKAESARVRREREAAALKAECEALMAQLAPEPDDVILERQRVLGGAA